MTTLSLKDHIKGNVTFVAYHNGDNKQNIPNFSRYRKGNVYIVNDDGKEEAIMEIPVDKGHLIYVTDTGLEVKVPLIDIGDADFLASDRAMLFMRYIRKTI